MASPFSWGASGATVYITGRTSGSERSEMNRPETIGETAALVDEAERPRNPGPGGPSGSRAGQRTRNRIRKEQGRLHVLVNDIWGAGIEWGRPVWESTLGAGLHTLRRAVDTHAITSHYALPSPPSLADAPRRHRGELA